MNAYEIIERLKNEPRNIVPNVQFCTLITAIIGTEYMEKEIFVSGEIINIIAEYDKNDVRIFNSNKPKNIGQIIDDLEKLPKYLEPKLEIKTLTNINIGSESINTELFIKGKVLWIQINNDNSILVGGLSGGNDD